MFLWIPPGAFRYPEIKATEVEGFKAETVTSVAFIPGYITKLAESNEHTLYIIGRIELQHMCIHWLHNVACSYYLATLSMTNCQYIYLCIAAIAYQESQQSV